MLRLLRTSLCLAVVAGALLPVSASAQSIPGEPCEAWTPCTQVSGGWATPDPGSGELTTVTCPSGSVAVGADAEFPADAGVLPVLVEVGGAGLGLGYAAANFALPGYTQTVTFQPWVGCSPIGQVTLQPGPGPQQFRGQGDGSAAPYRLHVRARRIRPARHVAVAVGCGRGERAVRSGSSVQFFTRRAPSLRVARRLPTGRAEPLPGCAPTSPRPAGVGDTERVEVQVTAICAG